MQHSSHFLDIDIRAGKAVFMQDLHAAAPAVWIMLGDFQEYGATATKNSLDIARRECCALPKCLQPLA